MSDWIGDFLHSSPGRDPDEEPKRTVEVLEESVIAEVDQYVEEFRMGEFLPKSRDAVVAEALLH